MEILIVLIVTVAVMRVVVRFDDATGPSDNTSDRDAGNHSGMDDDWITDPTKSFFLVNLWHEDD